MKFRLAVSKIPLGTLSVITEDISLMSGFGGKADIKSGENVKYRGPLSTRTSRWRVVSVDREGANYIECR